MNDFDMYSFLKGFALKTQETKKQVTELYVKGLIDRSEFIKRMNKAID